MAMFGPFSLAYEPLSTTPLTPSPVTPLPTHPAFRVVHGLAYGAAPGVVVVPGGRERSVERRRSLSVVPAERRPSLSVVPAPKEAPKAAVIRQRSTDSLRATPRLGSYEAAQLPLS